MQEHTKYKYYMQYLLEQVKRKINNGEITNENLVVIKGIIDRLINSDDLLKEVFLLSQIPSLKNFSLYLAFILKKISDHKISYDNFPINLEEDSSFILSELNNIDISKETNFIISDDQSKLDADIDSESFSGTKFKVEEITNELVDEEFHESVSIEEMSETMKSDYRELSTSRAEIPEDLYGFESAKIREEATPESKQSNPETKKSNDENKPIQTIHQTKEEINLSLNKKLIEYENKIFNLNQNLRKDFNTLIEKVLLESINDSDAKSIINNIITNSKSLSEEASELSFTLISQVYSVICEYFYLKLENQTEISQDKIKLMMQGLDAIESILNGDDYMKHNNLIKSLESLNQQKENKQSEEKPEETTVPESTSKDKHAKRLRYYILELENIFNRLEDIKGEFKHYEGLRFLSATLLIYKDIIKIAKESQIPKLAQMADGSYNFIKYLQNYRMNPFDNLTKQIYGYIVYNFKLIYLNKPTKDLDTFISYLNDPAKIYIETQNKKKK